MDDWYDLPDPKKKSDDWFDLPEKPADPFDDPKLQQLGRDTPLATSQQPATDEDWYARQRQKYAPQITLARKNLDAEGDRFAFRNITEAVRSVPLAFVRDRQKARLIDDKPTERTFEDIALMEKEHEDASKEGFWKHLGGKALSLPGHALAFAVGGQAAAGMPTAASRIAAMTAATPHLYAGQAFEEGLPRALATATLQNAAFAGMGGIAGRMIPALGLPQAVGRVGIEAAGGVPATMITETATNALGLTQGGIAPDLLAGNYEEAAKKAAGSALMFGAFKAGHELPGLMRSRPVPIPTLQKPAEPLGLIPQEPKPPEPTTPVEPAKAAPEATTVAPPKPAEPKIPATIEEVLAHPDLTPAQKIVLQARLEGKTLEEIGEKHSLSRQRVQKIEENALKAIGATNSVFTAEQQARELAAIEAKDKGMVSKDEASVTRLADNRTPEQKAADQQASDFLREHGENAGPSELLTPGSSLSAPPSVRPNRIAPDPMIGEAKPIREMMLNLQDTAGTIRAGGPSRGALGTYYPGSSKAVIRFSNDLDTSAHEIAHRLDDLHGIVRQWAGNRQRSPFDPELMSPTFQSTSRPSYKLSLRRAEGVAEFIRAWILNPAEATKAAPQFSKWFESKVPAKQRNDLRSFGDDVRRWAGASNVERTLSNVDVGLATPGLLQRAKEAMQSEGVGGSVIDKLNVAVNDSLAPIWKGVALAKELRGIKDLLPENDPMTRLRLFAGFDSKAMDALEHGPLTFDGQRATGVGGIDWLMEPFDKTSKATVEADFKATIAFGLSQRVIERMGSMLRDNPITGALEAQRISGAGGGIYSDAATAMEALKELKQNPAQLARIKEAAQRYRTWGDTLLDYMVDGRRITQEQRDQIKDANNYYFAMKRLMDTIDPTLFGGGSRRIASIGQPIKQFEGSTRTIENPYVSLMDYTYKMMRETDRNAGLLSFTDLLTKNRGMHQGDLVNFDQIGSRAKPGDPDAITIFRDGKPEEWQFAPAIHKAMKNWGIENRPNFLVRALMMPAKILRNAVTLSPQFIVRQMFRDPLHRSVVSHVDSKPWDHLYFATPQGAKDFAPLLSEFRRHGGALFGYHGSGREAYYGRMREALKEAAGDSSTILSYPSKIASGYKSLAEGSETIGRLAEYRKAFQEGKKRGYDDQNAAMFAASEARGIQDFAVAGTVLREINKFIPFTTAAARGLARVAEAAHDNPKAFAAKWMAYLGTLELMNYGWNYFTGNEDKLKKLSANRRDFFWNYRIGEDTWISIPKPWELGVMASGIGRSIDYVRGKTNAFDGFVQSMGQASAPVGISDIVGPYKAVAEIITNHNLFTDKEIVPTWERNKPVKDRKGASRASPAGKMISDLIGVDPRYVDTFIDGQLGGFGRLMTAPTLMDAGMRLSGVMYHPHQEKK